MASKEVNSESSWLIVEEIGNNGIITLNRPQALNAYSYEMAQKISATIDKWQETKSLIIIKGNGGNFCAGGDAKRNTILAKDPTESGRRMSRVVYSLNYKIGKLKVPYVAFIDGITMGGGAGLSVHGKYRVATERTVFAMPEVAIGYFPDVGASYFLPRLPGKLGYYLGLTGLRLKGEDVYHAGLATHYCQSAKMPELEKELLSVRNVNGIETVLERFCLKPEPKLPLSKYYDQINKSFNASSVEEIFRNLEIDDSEWAKETIKTLRSRPPKSLKVTHRALSLGEHLSLGECLQMEYRLRIRFTTNPDYHEGVRAVLVTKDKNPKWNPSQIEDVTVEMVESFFRPLPNGEQLPIDVSLVAKL